MLLGHADLTHTTVYLHLSQKHLQGAPNPLDHVQVSSTAHLQRSLFREPEINPAANTYLLLGFNPQDGKTVRIEPRIYNYSTAQPAIGIVVEFQVIPYDASLNSEICEDPINKAEGVTTGLVCPRSARRTIGRTIVPRLEPLQFTCAAGYDNPASTGCALSVFLNWNTTGFGPALACISHHG